MTTQERKKYLAAGIALVVIFAAIYFLFIFQRGPKGPEADKGEGIVKELSDVEFAKRPYVTLTPTSDGAEIIVSIENMAAFERIEYELIYLADNPQAVGEKIQRGTTGSGINTKEPKYKTSHLLGTASRGARSPDTGITDGKLVLHMYQGETEFQSETDWDMLQVGTKPIPVGTRDGNFKIDVGKFSKDYWVILMDTIGLPPAPPKEFDIEKVALPVYGAFSVASNFPKDSKLTITLIEDLENPELYRFVAKDNTWDQKDSTYDPETKTITAKIDSFDTFVVAPSK